MIVQHTVITVDPTADLQAAIDDAPDYSTIRLAPGIYTAPDANGFVIDHPVTIEGAGAPYVWEGIGPPIVAWDSGTIIRPYNATGDTDGAMDSTVFKIVAAAGQLLTHVVIRNLGIENPYTFPDVPATIGTGDGIRVDTTAVGAYVGYLRIEDVSIRMMGRDGLHFDGGALTSGGIDQSTVSRVRVVASRRHGFYMKHCYDVACDNVLSVGNQRCGGYVEGCNIMPFYHCLFNGNGRAFANDGSTIWNGTGTGDWPFYDQAQLYFNGCARITLTALDFEAWTGEYIASVWTPFNVQKALAFYNCTSGVITGCAVYNEHYEHGAIESWFISFDSECRGFLVAGNQVAACDFAVIGHDNLGTIGNVILQNTPTDYGDVAPGNIAPSAVAFTNQSDTDHSSPTGGNFVLMPMTDARAIDSNRHAQFLVGLQVPAVSNASVITSTIQRGTIIYDAGAAGLRVGSGWQGEWQTVAAGLVSIGGDIVTYDDEPVSY